MPARPEPSCSSEGARAASSQWSPGSHRASSGSGLRPLGRWVAVPVGWRLPFGGGLPRCALRAGAPLTCHSLVAARGLVPLHTFRNSRWVPEASHDQDPMCTKSATVLAAEVAGGQWGVIGAAQLEACGITRNTARRWRRRGRLYRIHSDVDAFGHPSVPPEGLMVAALLHVGATAVLSHRTAAWWWR